VPGAENEFWYTLRNYSLKKNTSDSDKFDILDILRHIFSHIHIHNKKGKGTVSR